MEAKEAAQIVAKYFRDLRDYQGSLTVEEVEIDDETNCWLITLSYLETSDDVFRVQRTRAYKIFEVDSEEGKVLSMKNRDQKIEPI